MHTRRIDLAKYIATQPRTNRRELARRVAAYLLETKQVGQLESLVRDVMTEREKQGVVEVLAKSAHPLDDATLREIKQLVKHYKPQAKTVVIEGGQDESVIGGITIQTAQQQLDMSVRAKIDTFKRITTKGI